MSAKHNCKHPDRGKSNYPDRLAKRGLSKAPQMEDVETLRKRQDNRITDTCSLKGSHREHDCNGVPWWNGRAVSADEDSNPRAEKLLRDIFAA